ncbi:FUSC family protein [Bizionia gelidisalsuginis]|uniref:FUSC family protein n=1 Tax=Bizionia gelidisalsuginis TaxID=291188 RepID=UPI001B86EBD5|nr:FUSC family membrane protein [Bizionia gelidisalsuginis]
MQNKIKNNIKTIELFLKGSSFYRGIVLTIAVVIPLFLFNYIDIFKYAPSIVLGAFLSAPSDIPGSLKRKINGVLITILLSTLVTFIILICKPIFIVLLLVIAALSFLISMISVYGFRASLISFSGLLAIVLSLAVSKPDMQSILIHSGLIAVGGIWYLVVSLLAGWIAPKKDDDQLLSDTLLLTGKYLKIRAKLLSKPHKRDKFSKKALIIQTQISEKHETLRELLLEGRKRSGRSHSNERRLLIFISSVDIFELALTNTLDYSKIDTLFGVNRQHLKAFKKMNKVMGNHLITLSELLIKKGQLPDDTILNTTLDETLQAIQDYKNEITLPKAREGAITLRNLNEYQKQLLEEIKAIRRVLGKVKSSSKVLLKDQESQQFLTLQEYRFNIIVQNFSLKSPMFRHALRIAVAIVFGFAVGSVLGVKNAYWIALTIIVIMRPNYGLTKERSKNRIIGTLIGAVIASAIVIITENTTVYMVLAIISLTFAFSLIQQSYKAGAAFITLTIVFVYALMDPNAFEVIQYRVIDTILGAGIAVLANYALLPSWEYKNLDGVIFEVIQANNNYLQATKTLYHKKGTNHLEYKVYRKKAFLAMSNLNAAFQRLTQDPKSKQKESVLIYDIVTLNHTILSAIASIGSYTINNNTTNPSEEFDILIAGISTSLNNAASLLNKDEMQKLYKPKHIQWAQEKLIANYDTLSQARDKDIAAGNVAIDSDFLLHLREAHLITNQLIWLKTLSSNLRKVTVKYKAAFS